MQRQLLEYLPYVAREYTELQSMMQAEQPEIERAWADVEQLLDEQFIHTAGEMGLSRWEKILYIIPKGTDTLEERRFRILARLCEQLPYTIRRLRSMLDALCGAGTCLVYVEENSYVLWVKLGLAAMSNMYEVRELLERVTPQNLVIEMRQRYAPPKEAGVWTGGWSCIGVRMGVNPE